MKKTYLKPIARTAVIDIVAEGIGVASPTNQADPDYDSGDGSNADARSRNLIWDD